MINKKAGTPIGDGWWIASDNKVYEVEATHYGWMIDHGKLIKQQYGIDINKAIQDGFGGYANIECDELIKHGWIQVRWYKGQVTINAWRRDRVYQAVNLVFSEGLNPTSIAVDVAGNFDIYKGKDEMREFFRKYSRKIQRILAIKRELINYLAR